MPRQAKKQTRRANNEGTVYKRPDGTWCCQVTVGYHPETGRPVRKTFYGKTQSEVVSKKTAVLQQLKEGQSFMPEADCLANDFIRNWLHLYKQPSVSARTFEWYCNLTEKHIYPAFDSVTLREVTTDKIQALFIDSIESKHLSLRTVEALRIILNQVLEHAVSGGLISNNPVKRARLPKSSREVKKEMTKAIPPDTFRELLIAAEKDEVIYPIMITLLFTGMRIGEALGLIWDNIDFDNRIITVDRAITQKPTYDAEGKRTGRSTIVASTKTKAGNRLIAVPPVVTEALHKWKIRLQDKDPALVEPGKTVFVNQNGALRTYSGFKTIYQRFLMRNGLSDQNLNLHRCRHTFATIMLENRINPKVVKDLLGHEDIKTTLGTYSHVTKDVYQDVAETLEKVYEKVKQESGQALDEGKILHSAKNFGE